MLKTFFAHHRLSILLISLGCHPLEGVTPHLFSPVRPPLSTSLCKFAHNKFLSFWCHPPGGCHPGRSDPRPLRPLVTSLTAQNSSDNLPSHPLNNHHASGEGSGEVSGEVELTSLTRHSTGNGLFRRRDDVIIE